MTELKSLLSELDALTENHVRIGHDLYKACEAELFPCDSLAYAVLQRSLQLKKGFQILLENGGYICGAGILRLQLDNVIRFSGIATSYDPHGIANKVWNGERLDKIKDAKGIKFTDKYLVKLLSHRYTNIETLYSLASAYVHLSDQHLAHFYQVSKPNEKGSRIITISDEDDHVSVEGKTKLVEAFLSVTRGILKVVDEWIIDRASLGSREILKQRFLKKNP